MGHLMSLTSSMQGQARNVHGKDFKPYLAFAQGHCLLGDLY